MKHSQLTLLSLLYSLSLTGILCNGGDEHGHGHHHHHHQEDEGGVPPTEELTDLIQNFGLAVLGKDQESADDVQPTEDHSHINVKALINELFHPSTTSTSTTMTPPTTSTQRLPIKSHDFGWELSPIDLVMSNSILEPVFSLEQRERQSRRSKSVYLTETPYLKSHDAEFEPKFDQLRSGKSLDLDSINLEPDQLTDKPTLPVLDTRRANFLLVNGGKRSKTGRKKKISGSHGHGKKTGAKHGQADPEDVLWRETVWSLKFRQTSPHPLVESESTTVTPLSDLSPFLQPPALERDETSHLAPHVTTDVRHGAHQTSKNSQQRQETTRLRDESRGPQGESRGGRRPTNKAIATNASSRKAGQFFGPARLKGGKSSGRNCKDHERNSEQPDTRHVKNVDKIQRERGAISVTIQNSRRGKKSDDMRKSNHHVHEDISDDEVEDIILRDDKVHFPFTADVNHKDRTSQVKSVPHKKNAVRRGKKFENQQRTSKQNIVDNKRQGETGLTGLHHKMRSSMTRSRFDCQHKSEGLHPDISSGCQIFYMCHESGRSGRFTCPVGTLFSQQLGVCDWAKKVDCTPSTP